MFKNFLPKIENWNNEDSSTLNIIGCKAEHWAYIFSTFQQTFKFFKNSNHVIIVDSIDTADKVYTVLKSLENELSVNILPGIESSPYIENLSTEINMVERFSILNDIVHQKKSTIVIATHESYRLLNPSADFFKKHSLKLEISEIFKPEDLSKKLIQLGYRHAPTVEEPGSFSSRGEIFDLYPINSKPIRLHYFDEMIEEIFYIDKETQKTLRNSPLENISIPPTPSSLLQPNQLINFRTNVPKPSVGQKEKFKARDEIISKVTNGEYIENIAPLVPLFSETTSTLVQLFEDEPIIHVLDSFDVFQKSSEFYDDLINEFQFHLEDKNSPNIIPEPTYIYSNNFEKLKESKCILVDENDTHLNFDEDVKNKLIINNYSFHNFISQYSDHLIDNKNIIKEFLSLLDHFKNDKQLKISYLYSTETSKNKFLNLTDGLKVECTQTNLSEGFYNENNRSLIISEADLFTYKRNEQKESKQNYDLFAEQLSTLVTGDYLIHNTHGVGKYLGLESMKVGEHSSDFLVLEYKDKDKVYVPVYKLNLIQKYGSADQTISIASLRNNQFSKTKEKARSAVKKLAFSIIKLQAERASSQAFAFSPPDEIYHDFELEFPYKETADQQSAIDSILKNMQKNQPMDHLVCGDVGFGKTEIAMRAAFKAVEDKKQVAILVPTTILSLQHFHSFSKRFEKFPINIEYISRFKSPKEAKIVLEKLEAGEIDIIIGTHKLLSDKIKFQDLGLLIIDEEHKFGVAHKEKIKRLKTSIDILTLTATPIPRTMQIAFMGLRDLSIIKTPPPRRQSIKSYVIKSDPQTLKKAIDYELNRGGQVFIVHNRVNDIEQLSANIRELVPGAKIVIAHGQMPEKDLEKRVNAFFNKEYQILISTVIIESGLDVPNANTMIINNADQYGLAQLHQLRGRIGRSDRKAFAYFVVPQNKKLSDIAQKRLKALITYAKLGSGFDIANCDLELRGSGDILGGEQSGHIDSIGLELYSQLLQEAIAEIKGEVKQSNDNIEINVPFSTFIPNTYITDAPTRLKYYKKLSNSQTIEDLNNFTVELNDIYGPLPIELESLFITLKCRILIKACGIKLLSATQTSISLHFEKELLENNSDLNNKVFSTFVNKGKSYQFSPDYKVFYSSSENLSLEDIFKFCINIHDKICN